MNHRLLIQATRIGLYSLVVALTLVNHLLQENYFNWALMKSFYGLAAIGLAAHLLPLVRLEAFFKKQKWVFVSFVLDLVLISSLMATSGLNQTLFLFMYLVTIILAGLTLQMRGALVMAAVASVGFTIGSWFGPEVKAMSFLFVLILNNIAFFVVAGLAGYLSDQLNLFQEKIEAQSLSLRMIRRLNELIVETIPAGLLTINSLGEILQFNPGAKEVFKKNELAGLNIYHLLPELQDQMGPLPSLQSAFKAESKYVSGEENSLLGLQVLPQASDFEVPTFLVVIEDLTQIRQMQFAVQQAEKMAAVGGLAAGIAHEIRNPLAGISGSIELLSQQFQSEDDKKLVRIILREIDRLNRLISEFLDFAKPEKPPVDRVQVGDILKEVVESARLSFTAEFQQKLKIEAQYGSVPAVLGHGDKLKQAFLNIVINALQAMENSKAPVLSVEVRSESGHVVLRIRDCGSGMKPETLKRMFEPFHTTKPKGTGLGLAVTHKILQAHGARVFVESSEGRGTEFVISFPLKTIENQRSPIENKLKEDIR